MRLGHVHWCSRELVICVPCCYSVRSARTLEALQYLNNCPTVHAEHTNNESGHSLTD